MLVTEAGISVQEPPCMWTLSRDHRLEAQKKQVTKLDSDCAWLRHTIPSSYAAPNAGTFVAPAE